MGTPEHGDGCRAFQDWLRAKTTRTRQGPARPALAAALGLLDSTCPALTAAGLSRRGSCNVQQARSGISWTRKAAAGLSIKGCLHRAAPETLQLALRQAGLGTFLDEVTSLMS